MTTIQINHGPFNGTSFGAGQTYIAAGIGPSDPPRTAIIKSAATQAFLTIFDPMQGWSVVIESKLLPVDMFPLSRDGAVPQAAVPCAQFDARLSNPDGTVVATASTVWTINGPMDWERGETNARSRLYEALGLPSRFEILDGKVESPLESTSPGFTAVPYTESSPGTEDLEQADAEDEAAGESTEEPVDEATSAQAASAQEDGNSGSDSTPATLELVPDSAKKDKPKSTRKKRARLSDDAEPPQALLDQITRLCKLRGKEVPEINTKAEANEFLRSLMGG